MTILVLFFFFKQKTAYEMRISDWSSDVCSSDLVDFGLVHAMIFDHASTGSFVVCLAVPVIYRHCVEEALVAEDRKDAGQVLLEFAICGGTPGEDRKSVV